MTSVCLEPMPVGSQPGRFRSCSMRYEMVEARSTATADPPPVLQARWSSIGFLHKQHHVGEAGLVAGFGNGDKTRRPAERVTATACHSARSGAVSAADCGGFQAQVQRRGPWVEATEWRGACTAPTGHSTRSEAVWGADRRRILRTWHFRRLTVINLMRRPCRFPDFASDWIIAGGVNCGQCPSGIKGKAKSEHDDD